MPAKVAKQVYEADVELASLIPDPKNAKKHDLGRITTSVHANGFYGVVYAQKSTRKILAGHGRAEGARRAGLKKIPVIWLDVDDTIAKRILLVDNPGKDDPGYDDEKLAALLQEVIESEGSLFGTGHDEADLLKLLTKTAGGETDPDSPDPGASQMQGLEYRVIADCKDEMDQADLLTKLEGLGYACRPLIS